MSHEKSLEVLIQLGRLVTDPVGRSAILPLVAEAAVSQVGAQASLIVLVDGDETLVAATHGCEQLRQNWRPDADLVGQELERAVISACGGAYEAARSAVLVSGADLFGSIIVLFETNRILEEARLDFLFALADLTATSLATVAQIERLEHANAELRATKLAVARAEKLRALGEMAAGIAHDLNNMLNPLSLHVQLAQLKLQGKEEPEVLASLEKMARLVRGGTEMLERLRQFSRQAPDVCVQPVSLDFVAEEAIAIAKPRMATRSRAMFTIVRELTNPPVVLAHAAEVLPAVVNLVVNAIDAMESAGKIFVRTGTERGGSWIEVEDTGPGMTDEVRGHVFEPFFTTKGEAGTGLGLAMVYACMVRHSGTAEVSSAAGRGARFRLWFPASGPLGAVQK